MSRINSGTILTAFFAILFGLVGVYLLRVALKPKPVVEAPVVEQKRPPAKVTIPMASRTLGIGHIVSMDDVALVRLTRQEMKDGGYTHAFMTSPNQIIGKTAKVEIKRGSTFDTRYFFPTGRGPGIAGRLKPGLRAVTFDVSSAHALLGFAGPGQNVDVLFHYAHGDNSGADENQQDSGDGWVPGHHAFNPPVALRDYDGNALAYANGNKSADGDSDMIGATVTLVQDAEILALGRQAIETEQASLISDDERIHLTVAVLPKDAELIHVASQHGELSITLRSPDDKEVVELDDPKTLSHIISMPEEPPPPPRPIPPKPQSMVIFRGNHRSQVDFNQSGTGRFAQWHLDTQPQNQVRAPANRRVLSPNQSAPSPNHYPPAQNQIPPSPNQPASSPFNNKEPFVPEFSSNRHRNRNRNPNPNPNPNPRNQTDSPPSQSVDEARLRESRVSEAKGFPQYFNPRQLAK